MTDFVYAISYRCSKRGYRRCNLWCPEYGRHVVCYQTGRHNKVPNVDLGLL